MKLNSNFFLNWNLYFYLSDVRVGNDTTQSCWVWYLLPHTWLAGKEGVSASLCAVVAEGFVQSVLNVD